MKLPKTALKPAIREAVYSSIIGRRRLPAPDQPESLIFNYVFQVYKIRIED